MKVRTLLILLITLGLGVWGFYEIALPRFWSTNSVRVSNVKGKVSAQNLLFIPVSLDPGDRVYPGTGIQTKNGRIDLSIGGADGLRIRKNSQVQLEEFSQWKKKETIKRKLATDDSDTQPLTLREEANVTKKDIMIEVKEGEVLTSIMDKPEKKVDYRIESSQAIAGIQGTQFAFLHDRKAGSKVFVKEGSVDVQSKVRDSIQKKLNPGQTAELNDAAKKVVTRSQNSKERKKLQELDDLSFEEIRKQLPDQQKKKLNKLSRDVMQSLNRALEIHKARNQRYPDELGEAVENPVDPWGQPYKYKVIDGGEDYKLSSSGPDKKHGTKDDIKIH